MFKNILLAIDGSPYSRAAVPAAIEIARKFESTVFVIHVVEHDRGRAAAYSVESPADATRLVADAVSQLRTAGLSAHGELVDRAVGHAPAAIVEGAAAHGVDLIVMGSRGVSDAMGVLAGSVTHKVMQLTDIPVLVTRPSKRDLRATALAGAATA